MSEKAADQDVVQSNPNSVNQPPVPPGTRLNAEEVEAVIAPKLAANHNENLLAAKLEAEEIEAVIAPKLAANHNETILE